MSKYSSTFLKSLNDEPLLEAKEGSKKKLLLGKSEMTEKKMTPAEKKERNKIFKGLDKKAVVKKYGKDIRGAIATKKAMELKEAAGDEAQGDETAWKASLDKGTNPDDFKVADNP